MIYYQGNPINKQERLLYNRALQFGDGVFETILFSNSQPRNLRLHELRLKAACQALNLNYPFKELGEVLASSIKLSNQTGGRIKLIVWRQSDGALGYNSVTSESDFLIEIKESPAPTILIKTRLEKAETQITASKYSRFKTLNSLPYVLAAIEKRERKVDELVLINTLGQVAECTSSNLFWIENDQLYTPTLQTGAIMGVMRSLIMSTFEVQEMDCSYQELASKEAIFSTNVASLSIYEAINEQPLKTEHHLLDEIKQLWEP